jgi:hypothetical protein
MFCDMVVAETGVDRLNNSIAVLAYSYERFYAYMLFQTRFRERL